MIRVAGFEGARLHLRLRPASKVSSEILKHKFYRSALIYFELLTILGGKTWKF